MSTKILFDTDIGSDIDDALALAYLLAQPDCDLLGITTVSGEAEERAMLASALCIAAGQDVPIFPGADLPLLVPQRQPRAPQAARLSNWPYDVGMPLGRAVDFLQGVIRAHPGEVTLLATGPLTNLALLFGIDAELPGLLKEVVIMGGHYLHRLAEAGPLEWNAICDPHALAMVLRSPVQVRAVGLDVTTQVVMPQAAVMKTFRNHPLLELVLDLAEVWFEQRDQIMFHDPLAAAVIFDEAICAFTAGTADVELGSERLLGYTFWEAGQDDTRHAIATEVDARRFFTHFFGTFG